MTDNKHITTITPQTVKAVRHCLNHGYAFAMYSLPDTDSCVFFADPDPQMTPGDGPEFFATDFASGYASRHRIRPVMDAAKILMYDGPAVRQSHASADEDAPFSHSQYIGRVDSLIASLRANGGKTVISRIFAMRPHTTLPQGVQRLFDSNPGAFRALFNTPATGCWLVASPELLLHASDGQMRTMSLAGTRRAGAVGPWDIKNIREQDIVTQAITDSFGSFGIAPHVQPLQTLRANLVEHLCTVITAQTDAALSHIRDIEPHRRSLYGGYFGLAQDGDKPRFTAYVTLRCGRLMHDRLDVFAGSGITPDSVAEDEWTEIAAKARQFADCFNAVIVDETTNNNISTKDNKTSNAVFTLQGDCC